LYRSEHIVPELKVKFWEDKKFIDADSIENGPVG
jgi:hypothetical protein